MITPDIRSYGAGFLLVLSFFFAPALMLKQSGEGGKADEGLVLRFFEGPFSDHPPAGWSTLSKKRNKDRMELLMFRFLKILDSVRSPGFYKQMLNRVNLERRNVKNNKAEQGVEKMLPEEKMALVCI